MPLTPAEKDLCGALSITLAFLEGAGEWEQAAAVRADLRDIFALDELIPEQPGKLEA